MDIANIDDIKQLFGDRIIVKQLKDDEKTKGGVYIPETVTERRAKRRRMAYKAIVEKIGAGVSFKRLKHKLCKGDIIYVDPVTLDCPIITMGESRYVIIREEDILAKEMPHA